MRSPTSLHESRVYSPENFWSPVEKTFATKSATSGPEQVQQKICTIAPLFDNLIGQQLHRNWYVDAKRLSSLEIDQKFKLGRFLNRQVGGLLTFENPANIITHKEIHVRHSVPIRHQTAVLSKGAYVVDRWYPIMR